MEFQGPIEVLGKNLEWGRCLPKDHFPPKSLAPLMTYLRSGLNEVGDVVTLEQAQVGIDDYEARGPGKAVTAAELKADYYKHLPGDEVEATTIIDFETYLPVGN